MSAMLDIAPQRAREFLASVRALLEGDDAAVDELVQRSALAREASDASDET